MCYNIFKIYCLIWTEILLFHIYQTISTCFASEKYILFPPHTECNKFRKIEYVKSNITMPYSWYPIYMLITRSKKQKDQTLSTYKFLMSSIMFFSEFELPLKNPVVRVKVISKWKDASAIIREETQMLMGDEKV